MGFLGWILLGVVVLWAADRLIRGRASTPLREREDAKRVGAVGTGIADSLPFLGQQRFDAPPPPPPVAFEPDGDHHATVDASEEDR